MEVLPAAASVYESVYALQSDGRVGYKRFVKVYIYDIYDYTWIHLSQSMTTHGYTYHRVFFKSYEDIFLIFLNQPFQLFKKINALSKWAYFPRHF